MKKSRRFRYFLAVTLAAAAVATIATICYLYLRPASSEISRSQFEQLTHAKLIHDAKILPTPYPGIYRVEGASESAGKTKSFSITTPLDAGQLKALVAEPKVVVQMPGGGLKDQWLNILSSLVLVGLVAGLLVFQTSLGRGQHSRIRSRPSVRFSDIAGIDEAKAEVREVVDFLRDPKKYRRLGGQLPKGILLVGPPGTGKTMLAKAIAGEAEANFFSAHGSDFNEVFVGVGAKRVRSIFRQAAKHKPAIIFIDEIDCLGKNRKFDTNSESQQTNNALLAAMDGFESSEGIIVVAATNRPEDLDEALMRPGRFDRKVHVPHPDLKGRRAILQTHVRNKPLADESALDVIAQTTPGMSGADLANLVNEAAILCAQQNTDKIRLADLEASRDKVRFGLERKSMVLTQREREMIACHEAGHALINLQKPLLPPLYKVSIIPRGQALGTTTLLPREDQNLYNREMLLQQLTVLMGGRAAETTFYGATTNGASGDLEMARQLARKMIHEWGMGEKLYYEPEQREAEQEINRLLANADAEALAIIQSQRENAQRLTDALLARETLTREEVVELLKAA
jgi:cell division protease FtsH